MLLRSDRFVYKTNRPANANIETSTAQLHALDDIPEASEVVCCAGPPVLVKEALPLGATLEGKSVDRSAVALAVPFCTILVVGTRSVVCPDASEVATGDSLSSAVCDGTVVVLAESSDSLGVGITETLTDEARDAELGVLEACAEEVLEACAEVVLEACSGCSEALEL